MTIPTVPNINQITSVLARMRTIREVQNYAAMHKTDPYIMSLASSEVNRREEAEIARQGQAGQQQFSKVNDQIIAGMSQGLPEDSGIGMLPAPNMQSMAGGGITGFADEGLVQDMSPDAINERFRQKQLQNIYNLFGATGTRRGYQSGMTPEEKQSGLTVPKTPPVSTTYPDIESLRVSNTDASTAAAPAPVSPPETTGPGIGALLPAAPRSFAAPAPAPAEDYMTQLEAQEKARGPAVNKFAGDMADINKSKEESATTTLAEIEAEQAARGIAGKGQDERLAKREAGIAADTKSNEAFSFINAGLAMMQSRGRGLAGIAEGATVGTKQYGEGIAKIRLAQEKADEARDKLDELRRNESTMNAKEIRAAKTDYRNTVIQGKELMLKGAMDATGMLRDEARAAVKSNIDVQESEKERVNKLKAAAIAAGPGNARNTMLAEAQKSEAKLRTEYGKLQTKVMAELSKDITYATATPAEKDAMQARSLRTALMNNPFLSSYASNVGFTTGPPGRGRTLDDNATAS